MEKKPSLDAHLPDQESVETWSDGELLAWFFERAGLSENPKKFGEIMIAQNQNQIGTILQNASLAERYFGSHEEVTHCLQILNAIQQIIERTARASLEGVPVQKNQEALIDYLRATMAYRRTEQFRLFLLNERNILIEDIVQHEGTIDHTPLYPREVAKAALQRKSAQHTSHVVLAHNHPSNYPTPSKLDQDVTRQVQQSLASFGITVQDHIIVTRGGHTSFREANLLVPTQHEPIFEKKQKETDKYIGLSSPGSITPITDALIPVVEERTPAMEARVRDTREPLLVDEKSARFISDEVLLSWLLARFNIVPQNSSGIAYMLLKQKGSLSALVSDPSSVHTIQTSNGENIAALERILTLTEQMLMVLKTIKERVISAHTDQMPILNTWYKFMAYLQASSPPKTPEGVMTQRILYVDRRNALISDECIERQPGMSDQQFIRQITVRCLELNASAITLVDNLSGKNLQGTQWFIPNSDIQLMVDLNRALAGLGIVLHDRMVINNTRVLS